MELIKENNQSQVEKLAEALKNILREPYGCPMCDSGKLRSPDKQHWNDCPYLIANNVLEAHNAALKSSHPQLSIDWEGLEGACEDWCRNEFTDSPPPIKVMTWLKNNLTKYIK